MRLRRVPFALIFVALSIAACPGDDDDSAGDDDSAVDDDDVTDDDDDDAADDDDDAGPPGIDELNAALRDNPDIQACFQTARDAGVELANLILLSLVIEPDGTVSSAGINTPAHAGTDLDGCISGVAIGLTFTPWDGDSVTLNYSFFPNA